MSSEDYKPGDHWVIDDRTGRKVRASETKREWNGLLVHKDTWEPRHPQDLVRGRADLQAVSNPRPRPVDTYIGPLATEIVDGHGFSSGFSQGFTRPANAGSMSIHVLTSERMVAGDNISIMLDNGDTHRGTIISVPDSETINFTPALPSAASSGNRVFDNSVITEPTLG